MYKLICNNLSKSKGSLTSFNSPCRKVAKNYESHRRLSATRRTIQSESDLRGNTTDQKKDFSNEETHPDMKTVSYNSFFRKEGIKRQLLERTRDPESGVRTMMTAASTSKFFYSSLIDQHQKNSSGKKKTFKNKQAVELYKKALEQCNRIKNNRYKAGSIYRTAKWYPKPIKPGYSWEEQDLQNAEEPEQYVIDDDNRKEQKTEKPPVKLKRIIHVLEDRKSCKVPITKEIESISVRKPNHQFKKKRCKITYPTHTISYKLTNKPTHFDRLMPDQKIVEKTVESPPDEPPQKPRFQQNLELLMKLSPPQKTLQFKSKVGLRKPEKMTEEATAKEMEEIAKKVRAKEEQEEFAAKATAIENPKGTAEEAFIKEHPTFEKATNRAKRAIANRYNKLMSKIFANSQTAKEEVIDEGISRNVKDLVRAKVATKKKREFKL